ncbi:Laminin subunit alpha-3 [Varanus komodoensis]|nr:Laminin subunit alpha-3 [Varanus komodoensis]
MKLKYFGHLMRRKDALEKSLMLGTIDGKRRRGRQRMRWLDGVTEAVSFVDMRNWRLEAVDNAMNVPVTFNPVSKSVVADVQELPSFVHNLYWIAPSSYLGEKGHQMKIVYVDPNNPLPDKQYYGSVQLVEYFYPAKFKPTPEPNFHCVLNVQGNFRHAGSNNLVSREELMMVLSRLEGLQIRGLYFTESQRLTLGEVGLEEATNTGNGEVAYNVETCSCPPEYVGDSCQNCQHNTAGEKCERCKEGYFGDASQGKCRECPCPSANSCAPGYFGNPLKRGGYCQKCNCLENGQLMNCDRLTGACNSCVITLLKDLSTMEAELHVIKFQMQDISGSAHTLGQMKHLEDRVRQLKILLNRYNSNIGTQGQKVDKLETDFIDLNHNINILKEKAENNYRKAETLFINFSKTNQKGKDLVSKVEILVTNIKVLLEQIAGTSAGGTSLPLENAAKELARAQHMIDEMRKRNFGQQLIEAEREKEEAQRLLERVRNEVQRHQAKNQRIIKTVRDSLNDYESKLRDLRESLREAKEQTKLAESLNGENEILLEDIKKRTEEMTKQQNNILDLLNSAEDSLSQANSVFGLLQYSKEEYEKLIAQLDGARKDLSEKVKSQSLSASKELLVVRAEEHARKLQDLARNLEEIKKNASKDALVTCAVEAATAYENIINAIKAAEAAANSANNAADSALSVELNLAMTEMSFAMIVKERLASRVREVSPEMNTRLHYQNDSQQADYLTEVSPTLEVIKSRLQDAESKKNVLQGELASFQGRLQGINRDDIDTMITSAKNMVRNANDITSNVLDELNPIKADVENIKSSYGTTQSVDFNRALKDANNTVKNLTNILPDLFNKITSINQQLMPIANISENINRIRELIQQARDAANKVVIPMRFNGSSGVEVRLPDILDDLKGYTSLSLFLQRPLSRLDSPRRQTSNMFVMYLGNKDSSKDYIGMAVRDGHLICAYSLGGNEAEIKLPASVSESEITEATLDLVRFERIYQYANISYIRGATSSSPSSPETFQDSSANTYTLLNLDPENVVFYVGGYPPDFDPPSTLQLSHYEGCIELDSLNDRVISLYNFKRTFNLNTTEVQPCRRYKEQSNKIYFEGIGYALVKSASSEKQGLLYEQTIQTTADEGLVFFAENQDKFISLRIDKGYLVFSYKVDSQPPREVKDKTVINNEDFQQIKLLITSDKVYLSKIGTIFMKTFLFNSYYLGGIPTSIRERFNISTPPFRGCMTSVKTPSGPLSSFSETLGVGRKCPEDWKLVRTAHFSKNGVLDLNEPGFPFPNDFQVGFGFHTLALDGTLFSYNLRVGDPDMFTILLRNGSVVVKLADEEGQSNKRYEDGLMHYINVIKEGDKVKLLVDDVLQSTVVAILGRKTSTPSIELGGNNFEGCISNVFIQSSREFPQVQNLIDNTKKTDVSLGFCMIRKQPQLMLLTELTDRHHLKILKKKKQIAYLTNAGLQQNNKECPLHTKLNFVTGAYHFGNTPDTHLLFATSPAASGDRSHFAVDVRTLSAKGLIFSMGNKLEKRYTALYLSKGRYVLLLADDGRMLTIRSKAKYNDGQWHTVAFSRTGKKMRLVVDGLMAREGKIPPTYSASIASPVYLGGAPPLNVQNVPKKSFVGCLRNFYMAGELVQTYLQNSGVLPCLDNTLENGVSFFNEGGHIVLDNSFSMSLEYQIMFNIRPRSLNGILIHTGSKQGNYLTVYMKEGMLTASGSNGTGEFSTSVTPQRSLCDGKWHFIAVTQKQNTVHLDIDVKNNYTTGPPTILSTSHGQPLYFGRIPVNLEIPWLPVRDVFLGCLKDVKINDKPVLLSKISGIHGVVSLQGCPVN